MKTRTILLTLVVLLLSCGVALGAKVRITIESYANPTLGIKSTVIETAGPYDPNDTNDQLEMSILARDFALSPEGWDLAYHGFTPGYIGPGWSNYIYHAQIYGPLWQNNKAFYDDLLGYQTIIDGHIMFHSWQIPLCRPT